MSDEEITALARFIGNNAPILLAIVGLVLLGAAAVVVVAWRLSHGVRGRLWTSVTRRFDGLDARRYLLLHLALGLAASLALVGFIALARVVVAGEGLARFDIALANALHAGATPDGVRVLSFLTHLGDGVRVAIMGVVVGALLFWRGERLLGIGWVVALVGAGLLNGALKAFYQRVRPAFEDPITVSGGWSFPSGHSMSAIVFAGMTAYLLRFAVRRPAARLAIVALALAWTLIIGYSRMYLGAHYLTDVIGGFAAGTVWLAVCISGVEVARRRLSARRTEAEGVDVAAQATPG